MLRLPLLLFVIMTVFMSSSGLTQPNDLSVGPLFESICPNGEPFMASENWEIYYTLDNTWMGERDTAYCLAAFSSWDVQLSSDELITNRPVFLRYVGDSILLEENTVYALSFFDSNQGYGFLLDNQNYCNDGFCQGIRIGIQIPADPLDSLNTHDLRWHQGPFMEDLMSLYSNIGLIPFGDQTLCIPSEKFIEGNYLKEIVLKIIPNPNWDLHLGGFNLMTTWNSTPTIPGWGEPDFWNDSPDGWIYYGFDEGPNATLVVHSDTTYPSPENMSYYDVYPNTNPDTVADLTLHIEELASLVFQPFTGLRGGLVEGSDSLRHNLSIVNEGAGICLPMGFEVVIEDDESYVHKGGNVSFNGPTACFQFQGGSQLRVENEATFTYGNTPAGMLYMFNGSEIHLQKYCSLEIGNQVFFNNDNSFDHDRIDIELGPFTSLLFKKGSKIRNWSEGRITKLHIYMNGGILDISELDEESLSNIVIHYPDPLDESSINILGETSHDYLEFGWSAQVVSNWNASVYDLSGNLVDEFVVTAGAGKNFKRRAVQQLSTGLYLLTLVSGDTLITGRFIKD